MTPSRFSHAARCSAVRPSASPAPTGSAFQQGRKRARALPHRRKRWEKRIKAWRRKSWPEGVRMPPFDQSSAVFSFAIVGPATRDRCVGCVGSGAGGHCTFVRVRPVGEVGSYRLDVAPGTGLAHGFSLSAHAPPSVAKDQLRLPLAMPDGVVQGSAAEPVPGVWVCSLGTRGGDAIKPSGGGKQT